MIPVTKPFLPPIEEYQKLLTNIWTRQWLTNNGPLVNELELNLKDYLGLENLLYVSNGTIAIQLAIKALQLSGEIITTPFSYVATTSCIVWENCKPVFVDIDPLTLNIDPKLIEAKITTQTSAILATHVFGNPCDIESIERIAQKHNLKVIYDAAHCFGTKYKNKSVFAYGDISTTSFHATKLFHTVEGGAVFASNKKLLAQLEMLRNFGHNGPDSFSGLGINGKNSEFHAAMGVLNLNYIESILVQRKLLSERYSKNLVKYSYQYQLITKDTQYNYSYFPIILKSEDHLKKAVSVLNANRIFPRRYFYPSLNLLPYVNNTRDLNNSDSISKKIICLPLYHTLNTEDVDYICMILKNIDNS
jgi:dTDP-4-amino-4,6-dideoxygalactose transaminase